MYGGEIWPRFIGAHLSGNLGEYLGAHSKIERILYRSHVFQFIPLSCETVQCSPAVFGRSGRLSAQTRWIAVPGSGDASSCLSLCGAPLPLPPPAFRLFEMPHLPREIAKCAAAAVRSTW